MLHRILLVNSLWYIIGQSEAWHGIGYHYDLSKSYQSLILCWSRTDLILLISHAYSQALNHTNSNY